MNERMSMADMERHIAGEEAILQRKVELGEISAQRADYIGSVLGEERRALCRSINADVDPEDFVGSRMNVVATILESVCRDEAASTDTEPGEILLQLLPALMKNLLRSFREVSNASLGEIPIDHSVEGSQ